VLLPEVHPEVATFTVEHMNFTGVNDLHDDCIDAAVAAYDILAPLSDESAVQEEEFEAQRRY
jgi:hypothetical protein